MNLTRHEKAAAAASGTLAVGLAVAVLLDSSRWSFALLGAESLLLSAVILLELRRQDSTSKANLERLEHKIDNLAVRVVTESQATHRELAGLIEDLAGRVRDGDTPGPSS